MTIKLAYHANCWGPLGCHPHGVTSIGSLSYLTYSDLRSSLQDIRRAGYDGVEIFDGNLLQYEDKPDELKAMLSESGLELAGVYSGANLIFPDILNEELQKIHRVAELAAYVGAKNLVVSGGAMRQWGVLSDDRRKASEGLEKIVEVAAFSKLTAHYHPHLTTLAETSDEISEILKYTNIHFCPDTADIAAVGSDVNELIKKWSDRISYIHLKGLQKAPLKYTPLDEGDLDISGVVEELKQVNYDGWITTELDAWPDPYGAALRSYNYLAGQVASSFSNNLVHAQK